MAALSAECECSWNRYEGVEGDADATAAVSENAPRVRVAASALTRIPRENMTDLRESGGMRISPHYERRPPVRK
jgi:hypothetical protein